MNLSDLNPNCYQLELDQYQNLIKLILKVNTLFKDFDGELKVTSGIRSLKDQERVDPNHPKSAHLTGQAVDILDTDGKIWEYVKKNIITMNTLELYAENKAPNDPHVHLQTRRPKSGNTIFIA